MLAHRLVSLGIALALCVSPALAQSGGTLEVGAFGRFTLFDDVFRFDDNVGGGLWLGVFLTPWLSLEGDASVTTTQGAGNIEVTYLPFRGRFVFQPALSGRFALLAGAGYVHNVYSNEVDGADNGATALLGMRWAVAGPLTLRLEGMMDFVPSAASGGVTAWNGGVQLGLSYLVAPVFGETVARPSDSDGDGVLDRDDRCPGTALGAEVDDRGCRLAADADGDGVDDSEDVCPGTPAGAEVDRRGCPVLRDSDGDGVDDSEDACPETPAGTRVDARGCPTPEGDGDADGVPDAEDACPESRMGVEVDARGCARPTDADGDGIVDAEDECPQTPVGATVDARGCPQPLDSDGDGVADAADACPGTAAGVAVDSNGCPRGSGDEDADGVPNVADACPSTPPGVAVDARGCWRLFAEGASRVVLVGVRFEADTTYELTEEARSVLDRVAAWLNANPSVAVEIAGHTDNRGFRPYALIRSLGQASAVRSYLITQGVSGSRLQAKGYGPDEPLTSNATPEGRARNRRIELRRLN